MNSEIIKFSKSIPRLFCVAILFYASMLKLAAGGKYISEFPFRQLLGLELTVFMAAVVVALEICIAYENLFAGGRHAREKAVLLSSMFCVFLLVSLTRLIPYVDAHFFPHGCGCFPSTTVAWLDSDSPIGQNVRNLLLFAISLINLVLVFKCGDWHENMPKMEAITT